MFWPCVPTHDGATGCLSAGRGRLEHRRQQFLGGDAGRRIENVLQAAIEIKHRETMHLRPDTRDIGGLLDGQMIEREIFVTLRGDDARDLDAVDLPVGWHELGHFAAANVVAAARGLTPT